ncbi:metallophosphoesterase family protein [Propionibacteriaceae bacterium G1746]
MRILHLSDTHLAKDGAWHYDKVDTVARLGDVLAAVPADFRADVVVVSGDVSNDDSPESYDLAGRLVGEYAAGLGVPVVWAPGNHDNNPHYDRLHRPEAGHFARGLVDVAGGVVAVADTRTPRRGHGSMPVGFGQLLRELAAVPGHRVLVQHHPPLAAPTPLHHALRLRGYEEWADRVSQAGVAAVLCGHYHLKRLGRWGTGHGETVPVVVAPAITNETVADHDEPGAELAVARHGAALVDTAEVSATRFVQVGADEPELVLRISAEKVRVVAEMAGAADEPGGGLPAGG